MTDTKTMMEKLQAPTRAQLQANIQISHNWMTAVRSGTFPGHASLHVATLLDFLEKQNAEATKAYEAESLSHPEWGTKEPTGVAK